MKYFASFWQSFPARRALPCAAAFVFVLRRLRLHLQRVYPACDNTLWPSKSTHWFFRVHRLRIRVDTLCPKEVFTWTQTSTVPPTTRRRPSSTRCGRSCASIWSTRRTPNCSAITPPHWCIRWTKTAARKPCGCCGGSCTAVSCGTPAGWRAGSPTAGRAWGRISRALWQTPASSMCRQALPRSSAPRPKPNKRPGAGGSASVPPAPLRRSAPPIWCSPTCPGAW